MVRREQCDPGNDIAIVIPDYMTSVIPDRMITAVPDRMITVVPDRMTTVVHTWPLYTIRKKRSEAVRTMWKVMISGGHSLQQS